MNAAAKDELITTLEHRFENNTRRHAGIDWSSVLAKLDAEMPQTPSPPEQPAASDAPQPASPQPATPPRAATDALRREAWVLAQPSSHYTIQISALGADTLVREYIKQHDLSATAAYIETLSQGNTVFRIIYGSYARRELADKALASLPRAISANAPWVRPFADLHKLVDRRYAERGAP